MQRGGLLQAALWRGLFQRQRGIRCFGGDLRRQRLQHIGAVSDQTRAIADQHIAAARPRIKGMSGHRQHFTPLIQRGAGGDQAARPARRLYHNQSFREAGDDAIAAGEIARLRLEPKGAFAEQQPLLPDVLVKAGVFAGVDHIRPASQHRQGSM